MKVNEIFSSIQGEGFYIGELCVFVRLSGCNLNCSWCDTKYALDSDSGEKMKEYEVAKEVVDMKTEHKIDSVVITGGEPLVQQESIIELLEYISKLNKLTIETNGMIEIKDDLIDDSFVFFSFSPKLENSGVDYDRSILEKNLVKLMENNFWNYQIKFVIENKEDIQEAVQMLTGIVVPEYIPLVFQPKAEPGDSREELIDKLDDLYKWVKETQISSTYDVRILPQLHTVIWGNKRGR